MAQGLISYVDTCQAVIGNIAAEAGQIISSRLPGLLADVGGPQGRT
jgi:hypothetical protein